MAFRSNAQAAQPADTSWKADGFVNLYLPKKNADGTIGKFKLGAIPLRASNPGEKKILDLLAKNPEKGVETIMKHLVMEYRDAKPGEGPDFAF